MIDIELVKKAKPINRIITQIDCSWREYLNKIKENTIIIPFNNDYKAIIKNDFILVEGYSGLLSIEKIIGNNKTYRILNPLRYYPYKIFGIFDKRGSFSGFTTEPILGFHYNGQTLGGRSLCTGDLKFENPKTKEELEKICYRIILTLKIINLKSLGDIFLPPDLPSHLEILRDISSSSIDNLLDEDIIEEINLLGE